MSIRIAGIATVAAAYRGCGVELGANAADRMRQYLRAKPKDKHGSHDYQLADTGFDLETERRRFDGHQNGRQRKSTHQRQQRRGAVSGHQLLITGMALRYLLH